MEHKDDMTVHREFIEEEIEALRNTSNDVEPIPPVGIPVSEPHYFTLTRTVL